jgi:hypothetical protein
MNTRTPLKSADLDGTSVEQRPPVAPRFVLAEQTAVVEEALVLDARAGLTPAEAVERKLASLLQGRPLPLSHLLSAGRIRRPG